METIITNQKTAVPSNKTVIAGKIITAICVMFLLFDSLGKIFKEIHSMEGSVALGWPQDQVQSIGIVLFLSTLLYLIPRTAVIGAILLTGYLGGAIAIMVRAGQPLYFASVFAILVWAGLALRKEKIRPFLLSGI